MCPKSEATSSCIDLPPSSHVPCLCTCHPRWENIHAVPQIITPSNAFSPKRLFDDYPHSGHSHHFTFFFFSLHLFKWFHCLISSCNYFSYQVTHLPVTPTMSAAAEQRHVFLACCFLQSQAQNPAHSKGLPEFNLLRAKQKLSNSALKLDFY